MTHSVIFRSIFNGVWSCIYDAMLLCVKMIFTRYPLVVMTGAVILWLLKYVDVVLVICLLLLLSDWVCMYKLEPLWHTQFPSSDAVKKVMDQGLFKYEYCDVVPEMISKEAMENSARKNNAVVLSNLPPDFVKVNFFVILWIFAHVVDSLMWCITCVFTGYLSPLSWPSFAISCEVAEGGN